MILRDLVFAHWKQYDPETGRGLDLSLLSDEQSSWTFKR